MLKLHELQEQRAAAVAEMRTLSDTAETQKRDLTADEDTKFGTLKTTIADLDKKIGRAQTLAEAERSAPAVVHGRLGDGAYEERARDFSITRAIRALPPRDLGGGDVDAGFEREISAEVARRSGRKFEGLAVPDQVFQQPQENRTLLVGSSAEGLTPTPLRADLFIDRLRNRLVVARLGATYLDGLVGSPIDIPRQTGSSTAQWVAEDGSLSETDAAFDDVTLTPKTVGSMTSYSRRTLLNASPSIEQIVRNLAAVIAQAIDAKAMTGDGSSKTPTGILHTSGVHDTGAGSAIAWDEVLDFIALIDGSNALDGALGWAINPFVVKKLRSTLVDSNTAGKMIMEEPNELAGYPALSSMQLPGGASDPTSGPESAMIFGDWSQLLVGSWTGVDILLNPYETTAYAKGRVIVRAMKDVDVAVRHGQAFAFANAISAN
jgi:HK97 family phage major capsid protein